MTIASPVQIQLTSFVDIILCSGTPKATAVAKVKRQMEDAYGPEKDFYKILREAIVEVHMQNRSKASLRTVVGGVTNQTKQKHFQSAVGGYLKWWGGKDLQWFSPPRSEYVQDGIAVNVNPELGLIFNEKKHVVKLYFKDAPKLTKQRADIITSLMEYSLRGACSEGTLLTVLDVRNSSLFTSQSSKPSKHKLLAIADAELAYIAKLWPQV